MLSGLIISKHARFTLRYHHGLFNDAEKQNKRTQIADSKVHTTHSQSRLALNTTTIEIQLAYKQHKLSFRSSNEAARVRDATAVRWRWRSDVSSLQAKHRLLEKRGSHVPMVTRCSPVNLQGSRARALAPTRPHGRGDTGPAHDDVRRPVHAYSPGLLLRTQARSPPLTLVTISVLSLSRSRGQLDLIV